ncbi:MAG: DNA-binding protein, partial [Peptostreptococcus porci]|nr:DNA-binding protein [Peptostreptococcus porci]
KDDEGNKIYHNCSAYGEKSDIPKDFKQGDFVKLFGQIRTSIDDNGKEHSNVRILSSKILKAKERMKGQDEKKESVLGAIKKYQAEDKEKPKEKKEAAKEAER